MSLFFVDIYDVFFIFFVGLRIEETKLRCLELVQLLGGSTVGFRLIVHLHGGIKTAEILGARFLIFVLLLTWVEVNDGDLIGWNLD
jgi:hypothetical protein